MIRKRLTYCLGVFLLLLWLCQECQSGTSGHGWRLIMQMKNDGLVEQTSIIDWFGEYMPDPTLGEGVYSVIYNGRLPMVYRDISVTEDYIYALYSGRSFKEYGM